MLQRLTNNMEEETRERILTVGELSELVSSVLESPYLQRLTLQGEVVSKTTRSGHIYFDLGDPDDTSLRRATFSCIVWRSLAFKLEVNFEVGDVLLVTGGLNYYPPSSKVSFICSKVQIWDQGEGKALAAKKKLLEKLDRLGLLDPARKRKIPRFVKKLAIVSSPEAAGYKDMLDTLSRRFPCEEVRLFEAQVQGANAPDSIVDALERAYSWSPDVVIIGRGGGSKTDLSCFDDEGVAMKISISPCPLITAIGHQIDVSVADRLADVVAITPTDAASKINPSLEELAEEVSQLRTNLVSVSDRRFSRAMMSILDMRRRLEGYMPSSRIARIEESIGTSRNRIRERLMTLTGDAYRNIETSRLTLLDRVNSAIASSEDRISMYRTSLLSTSVSSTLKRGFTIIKDESGVLGIKDLNLGQQVQIQFYDGTAEAEISDIDIER